ncbi:DUF3653 domain-containing protein [uncultured Pseudoxanthomonas sp.]|uniref:DUF3653 domain-containing protein n=1 Tax=uncultured Pseudoxanthomonas sp. TaxID=281701 RepID=UPI002597ACFB|nr:DUF3653 domain-containing protein [uncultured Pseudoxanthomonas sp.]
MRDRKLTGRWAGFSFEAGFLVTPEGRRIDPAQLQWLSLTCNLAREWTLMMDDAKQEAQERVRQEVVVPLRRRLAQRRRLACARHVQRG